MKDKLSQEELWATITSAFQIARKHWRRGQYGLGVSDSQNAEWENQIQRIHQAEGQIKARLQPVPKYKIRELVEKTAHKFLMGNFVNEIPPIEKMPLDETARWMQIIEGLLYSSFKKHDKLKESSDEK